jgi:LysM repeat protein
MKKIRPLSPLGMIGLVVVLGVLAGCYRPASPDLTPTVAGGAEAALSEEEQIAAAATESARATEAAAAETATPTEEPPTATPTTPPPTNTPVPTTAAAATQAPTATPLPTGQVTHVVRRGENMFRIALRYGTTVQAIASANGIANPALIYVGQSLVIPTSGSQPTQPPVGGTTYVVQRGDNLFRIALRYNLNYVHLAQYNGIANPSRIYVGQTLRIPPH